MTSKKEKQSWALKTGFAEMFARGVIMDVVTVDQAKIAEEAGAVAVMALERVPADIRKAGGVARMSSVKLVEEIKKSVNIPVMAKCRIGHFVEAQILQEIGVDFIDESEVLTPADEQFHINKKEFNVPFVCGATDLGEALRRVAEGAALLRTKGEPGTGNIVEAVRHLRSVQEGLRKIIHMPEEELMTESKNLGAPIHLLEKIRQEKRLPVPNFSAGGVSTPADAALVLQMGAEAVFVGSGIFKSSDPTAYAKAIVQAAAHYDDPAILREISLDLPAAMEGLELAAIDQKDRMSERGW